MSGDTPDEAAWGIVTDAAGGVMGEWRKHRYGQPAHFYPVGAQADSLPICGSRVPFGETYVGTPALTKQLCRTCRRRLEP